MSLPAASQPCRWRYVRARQRSAPSSERGKMTQNNNLQLPIRLLPRKGHQLGLIAFFGFFFGFSLFWMAGASGILDLDNGVIHIPPPGGWAEASFALFGLPFMVIGLCGIAGALL